MIQILIKDYISFGYTIIRLVYRKLRYRIRFVNPVRAFAGFTEITVTPETEVYLPSAFTRRSINYLFKKSAYFRPEKLYALNPETGTRVISGKFIRRPDGLFVDTGEQAFQRNRELERKSIEAPLREETLVTVPWGLGAASYGDFLNRVLPKLCRILSSLPVSERARTLVCLPEFARTPWAREYLKLIGVDMDNLHEEAPLKLGAHSKVFVASSPSIANSTGHPEDIKRVVEIIEKKLPLRVERTFRRIYISRRMGRVMQNESELIDGLEQRGFEIISLEGMSVEEQIRLFQDASIIAGPHGAGHANIMWSRPGTHLVEVLHPTWMHPCYAILASFNKSNYHCLVGYGGNSYGNWTRVSRYGILENPSINPNVFFKLLDSIIKNPNFETAN